MADKEWVQQYSNEMGGLYWYNQRTGEKLKGEPHNSSLAEEVSETYAPLTKYRRTQEYAPLVKPSPGGMKANADIAAYGDVNPENKVKIHPDGHIEWQGPPYEPAAKPGQRTTPLNNDDPNENLVKSSPENIPMPVPQVSPNDQDTVEARNDIQTERQEALMPSKINEARGRRMEEYLDRLKGAQEERRNSVRLAGALKGLSQANAMMGTTAGHIMHGMKGTVFEDTHLNAALKANEMEMSDDAVIQANDPKSAISESLRASVKQAFPTMQVPENASYSVLSTIFPQMAQQSESKTRAEIARGIQDTRNEDIKERTIEKELRAAFDAERKAVYTDSVVKNADKLISDLMSAKSVLKSKSPSALGIELSTMAKTVGKEAGVLTEQDISRVKGYIGIPGIADKVIEFFTGNYPKDRVQDWESIIENAAAVLPIIKEGRIRDRAKGFAVANKERLKAAGMTEADGEARILESHGYSVSNNAATPPTTTTQFKAGDKVSLKGKLVEIIKINNDGTFEYK